MLDLLDKANEINDMVTVDCTYSDVTVKELKKVEMYIRKTYLMLRHTHKLQEGDHTEDTFMTDLNASLIIDQKYIKARDRINTYVL